MLQLAWLGELLRMQRSDRVPNGAITGQVLPRELNAFFGLRNVCGIVCVCAFILDASSPKTKTRCTGFISQYKYPTWSSLGSWNTHARPPGDRYIPQIS
jgi:hypothetical protein